MVKTLFTSIGETYLHTYAIVYQHWLFLNANTFTEKQFHVKLSLQLNSTHEFEGSRNVHNFENNTRSMRKLSYLMRSNNGNKMANEDGYRFLAISQLITDQEC